MPKETKDEKKKFVVHKATIMPKDGKKKRHGDIVELDAEDARRYNNLGYLRPYVEDEYEDTYSGSQNVTRSTTVMAGAVEGEDEDVSETDTPEEGDPGTRSETTNPEVRGDKESHPTPITGTETRVSNRPTTETQNNSTNSSNGGRSRRRTTRD